MTETCESILDEVSGDLGWFAELFHVRLLSMADVEEAYSGPLHLHARSYLPIWKDGDANYAAIHLAPGKRWQDQAWVGLEHYSDVPLPMASAYRMLPRVLHLTTTAYPVPDDEQWRELMDLADIIPGAEPLEASLRVKVRPTEWSRVRASLDTGNVFEALLDQLKAQKTPASALATTQAFREKHPGNPHVQALWALALNAAGEPGAPEAALQALACEFPWTSEQRTPSFFRIFGQPDVSALWHRLLEVALQSPGSVGVFEPFRGIDLQSLQALATAGRQVSRNALESEQASLAFHVGRNACALAASARILDEGWQKWMHAVTAAIAPESPALELLTHCRKTFRPGEH